MTDEHDYPLTIAALRKRLALAEALADAARVLLSNVSDVRTFRGDHEDPPEYARAHGESEEDALWEALEAWDGSAKR